MEDVRRHNQAVLDSLVPGDLVEFQRSWLFSHWAVYIGNEEVVHFIERNSGGVFSSSSERSMTGVVRRDSFWTVAGRSKAFKNNRRDAKYSCDVIVTRALSKLGVSEFNLFLRNSEHFVAWCRYGEECSEQAQTIWTMFLGSMAVIVGGIAALTGLRR
ncbi:protein FAM84B-like [Lingula anatina]|uniref:Protein FAM84B-like n=1 Tax=Lingula anatina TaxID=7574 RepID=A0A1S3JXA7_LINAN|nr:protein FAM84B-like [Lingula anatina]|eukprot:XP_013414686.1 protein FAM84B-like [Lingula anatina]